MFITLTTVNDETTELINPAHIVRAWITPTVEDRYAKVQSALTLFVVFAGDPTTWRFVPVNEGGAPDRIVSDPDAARQALKSYVWSVTRPRF